MEPTSGISQRAGDSPPLAQSTARRGFLAAAVGGSVAWTAAQLPAASPAYRDGCLRLPDGRRLSYREYGSPAGEPLVYFHGMPGSRIEAGLVAEEVAASGARLVSIDRPGIGGSTYLSQRTVLDWPRDLGELADQLFGRGSRFAILAVSGGAPYALACLLRMPCRIRSLQLVAGHTPFDAPVEAGNQDGLVRLVRRLPRVAHLAFKVLGKRLCTHPDDVLATLTDKWREQDKQLILSDPVLKARFLANLRTAFRCDPRGLAHDVGLLAKPWGFAPACVGSAAKVTIWQGGCDPIVTPSMGRYFHRILKGSDFVFFPCDSHLTLPKRRAPEIIRRAQESSRRQPMDPSRVGKFHDASEEPQSGGRM